MQVFIIIVVFVAGAVIIGLVGYHSLQSVRQGRVLSRPVSLDRLKDFLDQVVAVHGTPELVEDLTTSQYGPVIWFRREYQEYRRSGKHGSWRTVDSRETGFDFCIHFPAGGRVVVQCHPTEVHGYKSSTEQESFFSYSRIRQKWFPLLPTMTVLGKLVLSGEGATLVPDNHVGMLFSPSSPKWAAFVEYAKGIAGFTLIAALLVAGAWGLIMILA
ncbi:MAG: hypothetical protein ACYTHM_23520 [Planctomycetota bacterium]|jgi:hypothetical protein